MLMEMHANRDGSLPVVRRYALELHSIGGDLKLLVRDAAPGTRAAVEFDVRMWMSDTTH